MERVYIGVDLHKVFFQACAVNAMADRLWEGRFPRTLDGFARFAPRLGASAAVAVEACGPTWPFVDQVVATGAHVCVVDPRKTKLKAGYAAKRTGWMRAAWRTRSGGTAWSVSTSRRPRFASSASCAAVAISWSGCGRAWCRCSGRCCSGAVTRMRPCGACIAPRGLAWLRHVTLPADAEATGRRLTRVLEAVHEEVVTANAALRARAQADPIAQALDDLVGIGPVLALTIRAEVGDVTRFARGGKLASYAGLVVRVASSADHRYYGTITREGSPWLRWRWSKPRCTRARGRTRSAAGRAG